MAGFVLRGPESCFAMPKSISFTKPAFDHHDVVGLQVAMNDRWLWISASAYAHCTHGSASFLMRTVRVQQPALLFREIPRRRIFPPGTMGSSPSSSGGCPFPFDELIVKNGQLSCVPASKTRMSFGCSTRCIARTRA